MGYSTVQYKGVHSYNCVVVQYGTHGVGITVFTPAANFDLVWVVKKKKKKRKKRKKKKEKRRFFLSFRWSI